MHPHSTNHVPIIENDFAIDRLDDQSWNASAEILIDRYWSGEHAPAGRHFKARVLWSTIALYVRFETGISEPMVASNSPRSDRKTHGLWDRDVCEIFIVPDAARPNKYYEFEIAPTGEWLDLAIDSSSGERVTDWEYSSGMKSGVGTDADKIVMALRIEWSAFGMTPNPGDKWRGNIFRCVGKAPDRGYLAWSPTMTQTPNFHVPEKFGEFIFTPGHTVIPPSTAIV